MTNHAEDSVNETLARLSSHGGRRRLVRWLVIVVMLLVTGAIVLVWYQRRGGDAVGYQTQPVEQGDLVITVTATGNLAATNQVEVGSELSGIITSMTADFNDSVKRNQPLVYLDDVRYQAAVLKSRAEVASAQANHRQALATRNGADKTLTRYRRTHELTGGKSPSQELIDQAEADLERAIASVDAAAAAIEMAEAGLQANENDLEKTVIYAPINGFVLSRDVEVGQTVAASLQAPILYTLAEDLRQMELQVDVDEADVGRVEDGQTATFTVDAYPQQQFTADITQVRYGAVTTDGVVTYQAVLSVANPDLLLRPGMTATAEIVVEKIADTLLVPNSALRYRPDSSVRQAGTSGGLLSSLMPGPRRRPSRIMTAAGTDKLPGQGATVWTLGADRRPAPLTVQTLATDGARTAVSAGGLQPGLAVITNEIRAGN
jgi:HlyD family secretion protein